MLNDRQPPPLKKNNFLHRYLTPMTKINKQQWN